MTGKRYKCMYKGCTTKWQGKPNRDTLKTHLKVCHNEVVSKLSDTFVHALTNIFLTYVNMQYKRAV